MELRDEYVVGWVLLGACLLRDSYMVVIGRQTSVVQNGTIDQQLCCSFALGAVDRCCCTHVTHPQCNTMHPKPAAYLVGCHMVV
jgi:hypothetical protein